VLADAADAVLVAHQVYPAKIAGNPKALGGFEELEAEV
jgi:hypothetical protein